MTIILVDLKPDYARIVSDTLSVERITNKFCHFNYKCDIFPEITAITTARGISSIRPTASIRIDHSYLPDGIMQSAPIVEIALANQFKQHDGDFYAVGWCPKRHAFAGFRCQSSNGWKSEELEHSIYALPGSEFADVPDEMTLDQIAIYMREMSKLTREKQPEDWTFGGDMIDTKVTRKGIAVRKIGRMPFYDEIKAELEQAHG